jgi:hypothetical protein
MPKQPDMRSPHTWGLCPKCHDYFVRILEGGTKIGICPKCDGNFSNANPNWREDD